MVAVAAKEPEQGAQFLDLFWQKQAAAGANLVSEQYKGVKPIHSNAGKSQKKIPSLATAAVGDGFVLFANDPKVLRDAINNVQAPELNLSSSADYQPNSLVASNDFKASIAPISRPNLGYVYLNWPSSQGFLETKLPIFKIVEQTGIGLFDNVRSLTLSSYGSEEGILRSSLFVRLGKAL